MAANMVAPGIGNESCLEGPVPKAVPKSPGFSR